MLVRTSEERSGVNSYALLTCPVFFYFSSPTPDVRWKKRNGSMRKASIIHHNTIMEIENLADDDKGIILLYMDNYYDNIIVVIVS